MWLEKDETLAVSRERRSLGTKKKRFGTQGGHSVRKGKQPTVLKIHKQSYGGVDPDFGYSRGEIGRSEKSSGQQDESSSSPRLTALAQFRKSA